MQPDLRWTAGPPSTPADEGLHQRVAHTARHRPEATALVAGDRRISYAELDRTADAWAAALVAAGVGPGDRVPVLLPRSAELVTALLAVLKTGAAYALLDPAWPAARLAEVTDVLAAPLLVAPAPVTGVGRPVWTPPAGPVTPPPGFRPAQVDGDAPACVFFTSGTTGRPKGVLTPHRATARLFAPGTFATFDERTVVPLAAPVPWDAFSLELWAALYHGGTSVVVTEPYLTAGALREVVSRHGVTTAWLTSSLFNMVVDEDPAAFRGLRQLMIGGERLSPDHVARFLRQHPEVLLLNGYGPVESTVFATTHPITPADCERPDGVPLGRPVPGTGVHVFDGERPCAVGEVGEICVTGDGLALGYLGDPALTAEKFVTLRLGGRLVRAYRTGDLGVRDGDRLLHFRGRADRQVKLRGHRIEPAEIERRLLDLLPVRACRVLVDRPADAEPKLLAWCVPQRAGDRLADARDVLRAALPGYQVPAEVLTVAAFPVTPQGKLDERALLAGYRPEPAGTATGAGDGGHTGTAAVVAEVVAAVLGRPTVPADVPFAALGGTSLDAGRVCARLAARLDRPVPLARLAAHPTVAALAGWLDDNPPPERTGAEPDPGLVPLTPLQLVYLTRHLLDPTDLTSHCLLTWVVAGDLDQAALATAVGAVHARHEPLRAAYLADPRPVAQVVDLAPPPVEALPAQPSVAAAVGALRTLFGTELLIGEADVWRVAVVPAGPVTVLGVVVHHIAFDGWSEAVLARDLAAAYNAARRGSAAPDTPAPPSLARTHRDHLARLADSGLDTHRERRRAELAGVPAIRWPGYPGPADGGEPGLIEVPLSPAVVAGVDAQARAAGVSRFVVLLRHHGAALAEVTGERDLAVGVPVAQRHGAGSELAVGCHLTMLCVRLRGAALGDGPTATRAVGEAFGAAFAAQDVPLQDLLRMADLPGGHRPPLFQTLFALQDNAPPTLALDGAEATFVRQPYLDLPLELHTELWPEADGGLRLTVWYRRDAVAGSCARELAKRFEERLHTSSPGGSR
ncbi:non-ribosomal peptide synthetase [Micromonospora rosaria]|uniref:Non-ribosomal peptide synthetase n=1 Tax=Micromonospora rosaria TaxID=47874 RepID=A0A136PXW3_9ACTN|nr:non-ribosomal peptide synthetase [Micromonospora rosaria]KXK63104.1 non-ribosomal peptide synthetase [Micromonospora rosaria]